MKIVLDNIVFSLQKSGGISTLWGELIEFLKCSNAETYFLEYDKALENIVRKEINMANGQFINQQKHKSLQIERFQNPKLPDLKEKFLFFSSYYRTSSNSNAINISVVHDFTHERFHTGLRKIIHTTQKKNALKKSKGIICISENTRKDLNHFFPSIDNSKVKVIHNGVAECFFKLENKIFWKDIAENLSYLEGKKNVVFIGSRAGYKNFHLAVSAFALLPPDYHFIIIGSPLTKSEEELLEKKIIKSNYTSLSHIDNVTLNKIYNKSFLLLYPSSYEGFGIPVIEAMKTGLPVIAQSTSSIPEVAGKAGILLENTSPENIKNEIVKLEDLNYSKRISDAGLLQAAKFSWNKTMEQYVEFFKSLL